MKKFYVLSIALFVLMLRCFSQAGTLDLSFGMVGRVTTNMTELNKGNEAIKALAIQTDGKIIAAGTTFSPSVIFRYNTDGSPDNSFGENGMAFCFGFQVSTIVLQNDGKILIGSSSFQLARFNADGTPDNSFGINGRTFVSFGFTYATANAIVLQNNGKIVMAGSCYTGSHDDFAIARFNADGSLDNSFDGEGKLITAFSPSDNKIAGIAIQSDGKIVAAGYNYNGTSATLFALARYNVDGSLDNSFDGDGKLTTSFGTSSDMASSVKILSNGKILVAGYSTGDLALARYNTNGSLDNSFDGDGKLTTPMGAFSNSAASLVILNDGKILVSGTSNYDFAVIRFNPDGSPDNTFDGDGKVITDINGNYDLVSAMAVQSDGKIIVGGYGSSNPGGNKDFATVRYNVDGSLDNSFDGDGKLTYHFNTSYDIGRAIAVQSDGKIIVAGNTGLVELGSNNDYAIARYNPNGTPDNSFDGDGKVVTNIGANDAVARAIAIQPDGKILVAGHSAMNGSEYDFSLVRYNTNGSLDNSFDGDGKVTTAFVSNSTDVVTCMAIQNDGKIVVAGYTGRNLDYDFAIARYNTNGSLDNSFNGTGKMTIPLGSSSDQAYCIAIQPDGKIIVGGISNNKFALLRFNPNGTPDNSFDGDGILLNATIGEVSSVAVQPDGKILALSRSGGAFVVSRYNTDGSVDNNFDGDGKVTTEMGGTSIKPVSIALQNNGKIIVAGGKESDYALARYNNDGSLDNSFDGDGKTILDLGPNSQEILYAMSLSSDHIYLSGEIRNASASDFVLASVFMEAPGHLTLQLIDFSGKLVNNDALLSWKTENEVNMWKYIIERSTDGRNYIAIGSMMASNRTGIQYYNFTDFNITSFNAPVVYYRLKQKGIDGSFTYSRIVVLPIDKTIVLFYPNPVINNVNIVFTINRQKKIVVRIFDNKGRLVKQQQWNLSAGSVSLSMNVDGLAKGIYYLQITGDDIDYKKKFVK